MTHSFANAQLIIPGEDEPKPGMLSIDGERIALVGQTGDDGDSEATDCNGLILAPGIVDLGVFAIDKPAFRAGGITRAALMPDQNPILDMPAMI